MTQETRTQETPTPTPDSEELTASELALVAGGTEGAPSSPSDHNGVVDSGKATPLLM